MTEVSANGEVVIGDPKNPGKLRVVVEIFLPPPASGLRKTTKQEEALKILYDNIALSLASYLGATQELLMGDPPLGKKSVATLLEHINSAGEELRKIDSKITDEQKEPGKDFMLAYQ